MKSLFKPIPKSRKVKLLLVLVLVVFEAGVFLYAAKHPEVKALRGYLIKSGASYHVAWRDQDLRLDSRSYPSLREALDFANNELKLSDGRNPTWDDSLEYLDVRERSGTYVVLWKTFKLQYLYQMTFFRRSEAQYFLSAFRRGHYSPSPMGHAIPLTPIE